MSGRRQAVGGPVRVGRAEPHGPSTARRSKLVALSTVLAAAFALPVAAGAQEWTAEVRGGEMRFDGGPGLESSSAVASLGRVSPLSAIGLSFGLPVGGDDPLWGALAASRRVAGRAGAFTFGVDVAGDLFVQRDRAGQEPDDGLFGGPGGLLPRHRPIPEEPLDGWGASARLMPMVGVAWGDVGLEARAGGAAYRSELAGSTLERELLEADVTLRFAPSRRVLLAATGRHASATEGSYDRVGARAILDWGRGTAWGSVGKWLEDGLDGVEWSAGATIDVVDRVALRVDARRRVFDPLLLSPEHTSWGVGLSVSLGGAPTPPAPPVPAAYTDGRATIVLDGDAVSGAMDQDGGGGAPRIAGDFTGWEPVAMERAGDGWRFTRALEPGVYSYAFVTPGGEWFVPEGHPGRKPDDFGGWVAVLVVEGA